MNNLKRILSITLGGVIIAGTTSLAGITGIVNAPNGLVLREDASKSANPVMTVSDNSKVEIEERDGEWYKVKYNSHEGYLFAEYVEIEEEEQNEIIETETTVENEGNVEEQIEETEEQQTETAPQKQNAKSDVKIYTIPSVTAKIITIANASEELIINYEINNWVNVTYGNTTGWARKYFINNEPITVETETQGTETQGTETEVVENEEVEEETETTVTIIDNKKGYVDVSSSANVREKASTDSAIINTLLRNTEVTIVAEEGDFYKIKYQDITGYISKSLVSDEPLQEVTSRGSSERKENITEDTVSDEIQGNESSSNETQNNETQNKEIENKETTISTLGNDVVSYAKKYIGYDYVSGGTTPSNGFDCSGFVYYVFNSCGYSLSRSCQVQAQSGTAVSRDNLSAGDLLFFCNGANGTIGHVGIYIGEGQFVHAANSRRGVTTDTINSGYYDKYYYSARRIVD